MDRTLLIVVPIVLIVALPALMYLGWRARRRRQQHVAAPVAVPADLGATLGAFDGKYVATTASGNPLDRIAVHGLGFRSSASLTVTDTGLLVQRPGSDDVWIPRADVLDRRSATWTIDRVVEPGGLDLVQWKLGGATVDSYFRMIDPDAFEKAIDQLLPKKATA